MELPVDTRINEYTIKLIEGKQFPYGPIYALNSVELKTWKTYIKTHLRNGFIRSYKSLADAPILFDKKPNSSFWLCVNYRGLNNLSIKITTPFY